MRSSGPSTLDKEVTCLPNLRRATGSAENGSIAVSRSESVNPATGETIGTYAEAGAAEARQAIAAARKSFVATDWRENRRLRAKALNEMADRFEARTDDLVAILSLENGKIEAEARFEVGMVPSKLRFYAALALTEFGRAIETAPGRYSTTLRQAVGVAGIIAPWNSPVVLFIRSLAPALAAGCTVVGKLPGFTAQTNARMCEVFAEVKSLPVGRDQRLHRTCTATARGR